MDAIHNSNNYGKRLKSNSTLKKEALKAALNAESDHEKMIAVYDFLSSKIDWDETYGLYVEKNLDDIYEEGTGNGSELNLILTQMLREVGLNADPIIISTRNNGEIIDIYPIDNQFNHTIVRVIIEGKTYLLDAKNEKRPYNLLPVSSLNGKGLVINGEQRVEWVPLNNKVQNRMRSLISISVKDDGTLKGKIQSINDGFFAYIFRDGFYQNGEKEEMREYIFDDKDEISIDSFSVSKDEKNGQFGYQIDFEENLDVTNGVMYINPMIIEAVLENPFKLKERKYPVDFEFVHSKNITMSYILPSGWEIEELPESKAFSLNDGTIFYRRLIQSVGKSISIRYDFAVKKTRFMANQYDELKNLYENMVNENAERIVLKRTAE